MFANGKSCLLIGMWLWPASAGWCKEIDRGRDEYLGPLAARLTRKPSDLTALAGKNRGVFPTAKIYQRIDGRSTPHGNSEMPVWGCRHSPASRATGRRTFRPRPTRLPSRSLMRSGAGDQTAHPLDPRIPQPNSRTIWMRRNVSCLLRRDARRVASPHKWRYARSSSRSTKPRKVPGSRPRSQRSTLALPTRPCAS